MKIRKNAFFLLQLDEMQQVCYNNQKVGEMTRISFIMTERVKEWKL